MIARAGIALIGTALGLAAGCAQRNLAVAAKPTTDELPHFKEKNTAIEATILVPDRRDEDRVQLVPSFKEPELTPEERAALGQEPLDFKFLPYNERSLPLGSPVGPWFGGVTTAAGGRAKPSVLLSPWRSAIGIAGRGGVAAGVDIFGSRISGLAQRREGVSVVGPRAGITVGTDTSASKISQRKTRTEK